MRTYRRSFIGILAASLLIGSIAGCGGNGSANGNPPINTENSMNFQGQVPTLNVTLTTAVTASNTPQQIDILLPNGAKPQAVWIPAGISVAAGQSIVVIPADTVCFDNLVGGAAGVKGIRPAQGSILPGTVTLNGNATGVFLVNGVLSGNLGFPAGDYVINMVGPFTDTNGGQSLTIQDFQFEFECNGTVTSLPETIKGTIPVNGANNLHNILNLTFNSAYASGVGIFSFDDSNGTITQTDAVNADGTCIIHDYTNTSGALQIPPLGVNTVSFIH